MDLFEFHIMEKLKTTLLSLKARNAVPVNLGIVKNEESEARIRYLFNKFEKYGTLLKKLLRLFTEEK